MSNKYRQAARDGSEQAVQRRTKPGATTRTEALAHQIQKRAASSVWNPPTEMHEKVGDGWDVQRLESATPFAASGTDDSAEHVQTAASHATSGTSGTLPFLDQIQASFGPAHDLSGVKSHTDGPAAEGSAAMGAEAFASGDRVAFGGTPTLHTAAHEAAHVVQQRGGIQLKGGVGEAGDPYEQHADAVADRVVQGKSADDLLATPIGGTSGAAVHAVQQKPQGAAAAPQEEGAEKPADHAALVETYKDAVGSVFLRLRDGVSQANRMLLKEIDQYQDKHADSSVLVKGAKMALEKGCEWFVEQLKKADPVFGKVAGLIGGRFLAVIEGADGPEPNPDLDLLAAFMSSQDTVITNSQIAFYQGWRTIKGSLEAMSGDDVQRLTDATFAHASQGLAEAQTLQTTMEWANVVARAHHGATPGWDHWSPTGSRDAVATDHAAAPPDAASGRPDPTGSNIDEDTAQPILDRETKSQQDGQHGILQIDLRIHGGRFALDDLHSWEASNVRMEGVQDFVKKELKKLPTVKDARVNKVIRVWPDEAENVGARWPEMVFLETADGYIRDQKVYAFPQETYSYRDDHYSDDKLAAAAAKFADSLPMSLLE